MVLLVAIVISLIIGFATGGSLDGVRRIGRIRYLPLLVLALVVQLLIFTPPVGGYAWVHDIGPYLHIATILTSFFVMTRNFHIPGLSIIAVGAALNAIAIIANGGYMPSPEDALREAGQFNDVYVTEEEKRTDDYIFSNSTVEDEDTNLAFLGDVIPIPEELPLANVVSLGDIVIDIGAVFAVIRVMHLGRARDEDESEDEDREVRDQLEASRTT